MYFKLIPVLISVILLLVLVQCQAQVKEKRALETGASPAVALETRDDFCRGVSLVAPPREFEDNPLAPLKAINADYVAVIPYAFSQQGEAAVHYNSGRQWWGETSEGVAKTIEYAHAHGLKVMVKPHLWIGGHGWAGEFELETEDKHVLWERDYSEYILHFARVADSLHAEMFCIGNELKLLVQKRPQYWRHLVREVRKVYSGKLTYAANWDNYMNVAFWDDLDLIGINAYFPLAAGASPAKDAIAAAWQPHKKALQQWSLQWNKPVIFTEYGYCSIDNATEKPWHNSDRGSVNLALQERAYEVLYEQFWPEPWFRGGFLWKWYAGMEHTGRNADSDYTPQNKPAEQVIKDWYGKPLIIND